MKTAASDICMTRMTPTTDDELKPDAIVHPDGRRTDKELHEPLLGEDRWPEDVDYGPKATKPPKKPLDT